jgi:hypothetical protein
MYSIKENMYLWKHSVHSKDLEKELRKIYGRFTVRDMKKYAPDPFSLKNEAYKPYFRFRIMEYGTRVDDISFFNFRLETYEDGTIEFQRPFSTKLNWIHFNGKCDIIFDDLNRQIIIDVQSEVYYKTGKRRYEDRADIEEGRPIQIATRKNYIRSESTHYNKKYFLDKRTVTPRSQRYIERELEIRAARIRRRKENEK